MTDRASRHLLLRRHLDRTVLDLTASAIAEPPSATFPEPGPLDVLALALDRIVRTGDDTAAEATRLRDSIRDRLVPDGEVGRGHAEDDAVATAAWIESARLDTGREPRLDPAWFLRRFPRWREGRFVSPLMGIWSIARWLNRFDRAVGGGDTANHPDPNLPCTLRRMLAAHRRADGGYGRFDPLLHESLAVLIRRELGDVDPDPAGSIRRILDAWQRDDEIEIAFHTTSIGPDGLAIELHDDPRRTAGTALACLALHAATDPPDQARVEPAPEDRYRIDLRLGDDPAAQVRRNLATLRARPAMDAPASTVGTEAADPFETPRRHVTLTEAMSDALARLGPAIVTPQSADRVMTAVARTADAHVKGATFGLEVRLHPGDDTLDFLWCLRRRDRNLTALLDDPDPNSRFRHLARLWNVPPGGDPPPIAMLDRIWFEHDLHHDDSSIPPAFFFGPSAIQLARTETYGVTDVASNVRRVVDALDLEPATSSWLHRTASRIERLPTDRSVFQTGIMFSRASHPVRVCFKPLGERAGLSDLLGELDLGREASRSDRLLDTVIDADGRVAICVDVSPDGVHRRIGFELHAPRDRATSGFFADLLDPISRNVEIDRPKTDAFLAIEGWAELADESGCHREINHLKIVTRPDAATELKGYLALSRRTAPSFQPTGR